MRFAIIESGGKQYRAVEGRAIDVDRLPIGTGKKFDFERILLMADGDEVMVGTPTVTGIEVKATVVDHIKGPKIDRLRYRPKKRIRVRGGHRQQYTRLMVDFIGRPGEERTLAPHAHLPRVQVPGSAGEAEKPAPSKVEGKQETKVVVEAQKAPKKEKQAKPRKEATAASSKGKPATKKTPAKKSTTKKSTTSKSSSKK